MYDVNEKFENLVLFMAENYNSYDTELNDAITTFEEAIETSGNTGRCKAGRRRVVL